MNKLASTVLGGLFAIGALVVLRNLRVPAPRPEPPRLEPMIVIYTEPRYDMPPCRPAPARDRLIVLPYKSAS